MSISRFLKRVLTPALILITLCCLLTACGFQLRSKNELPASLHQLVLIPLKPYSKFTTLLKEMINSMGIKLLPEKSKQARFALVITKDDFTHSRAQSVNANLPTSASYSQTAEVEIKDLKTGAILTSNTFSKSESQSLNTNQLYTPGTNRVAVSSLNEQIVAQIFYWLSSHNIKKILDHAANNKRA